MSDPPSSNSPVLFSEGWLFAALLDMVMEHCGAKQDGTIKSFAVRANARAMRLLADAGFIQITSRHDDDIKALVTASGHELMAAAAEQLGGVSQ